MDNILNAINNYINNGKLSDTGSLLEELIIANPNNTSEIIFYVMKANISNGKTKRNAKKAILNIINSMKLENQDELSFLATFGFLCAYLHTKSVDEILEVIFEMFKQNSFLDSDIVSALVSNGLEDHRIEMTVKELILKITKKRQELKQIDNKLFFRIILCFADACFKKNEIDFFKEVLFEIIKQNSNLVYDINFTLTQTLFSHIECLSEISKNIFYNMPLDKANDQELVKSIKQYLALALSKYLENTLLNVQNIEFPKRNCRDIEFETQMLKMLKAYNVINPAIEKFEDIPVNSLINDWANFFNNKIQYDGVDSGQFFQILPYILKDFANGKTLEDLFNSNLLKSFYHVDLFCKNDVLNHFEKLKNSFQKLGSTSIIQVGVSDAKSFGHAIVCIIKKDSMEIIDSNLSFFHYFDRNMFLNKQRYQVNNTCYLNAGFAIKAILDLAKESSLENALDNLREIKDGQQNIVFKISKETAKLYEMLEHTKNSQFIGFDDCAYVDIAPSATIPTIQTMVQEAQKVQNGTEMQQQTQQLKREVQQLKINYKDFIISEELIIRTFKMQGCKVEKSKGWVVIKKEVQTENRSNKERSLQ